MRVEGIGLISPSERKGIGLSPRKTSLQRESDLRRRRTSKSVSQSLTLDSTPPLTMPESSPRDSRPREPLFRTGGRRP